LSYRGTQICLWARGSCCLSRNYQPGRISQIQAYSTQKHPGPPTNSSTSEQKGRHAGEFGRQWSQRSAQAATATLNYWWGRYEEFVGLNEVRVAQTKVTEAEEAFMVARGIVREAHASLEALQVRLKEVRDRLDRVSREEAHYLELATLENTHPSRQSSEREKFSLFSAAVRESHEKERTRAERTKNWSIIGSVLGALIGVMGSTYINRVRLQELKNLLLEAQKGPESLQEALKVQAGNHRSQQDELRGLIDSLRVALAEAFTQQSSAPREEGQTRSPPPLSISALKALNMGSQRSQTLLESLPPQLGQLEKGLGRVEGELLTVRKLLETKPQPETGTGQPSFPSPGTEDRWGSETVMRSLEDTKRTLGEQIRTNTVYNAVLTSAATAVTICAVYLLLRGTG
uniref:Coiled-coil domain containing 51 n=1 Tax=Nothobranchius furzeri TaxID=105023 RepID=A0A8C6MA42_NOTFU